VVERYTYDEYGAVQVWNTNNQPVSTAPRTRTLFTGREYDATVGLYHYRHRWYHPGIGRFVQPDPIGFEGGDVNWYSYVRNNSTNAIDPTGFSPAWQLPRELGQGQPGYDDGFNQGAGNAAVFCAAALAAWGGAALLAEAGLAAGVDGAMKAALVGAIGGAAHSAGEDLLDDRPVDPGDVIKDAERGALGGFCAAGAKSAGGGELVKKLADAIGKLFP